MPPVRGQWVRNLRPARPLEDEPVCLPQTLYSAVGQVGRDAVDWAVGIGIEMAHRAIELTPDFGGGETAVRTLRLGTESAAISTLVGIDAGALQITGVTPESERQMREYVHRRIPLEKVWASIRVGHSWFAEYYISACRDLVELGEQPEQLELVSRILFGFVNAFATGVGDAYHQEERRWLTSAAAARDETVRAVLAGDDIDLRAASRVLDYDLVSQHHLALILCQDATGAVDASALQKTASALLHQAGATSCVVMPVGRTEVWAWGGSRMAFPAISALGTADTPGTRIVAGLPHKGAAGFRRSHDEAQQAARVVRLTDPQHESADPVRYDDISLVALLTADPAHARSFLHDELGRLAADDPLTRTLRETLLTYLKCKHSPSTAAAQLFVAKNTVVYRVKRAEELLGRSIDERQAQLWAALLLADALGVGTSEPDSTDPAPPTDARVPSVGASGPTAAQRTH